MATMRDHAVQVHNEAADDCYKMAECEKAEGKCYKSMMKADGLDDDQKRFHSDMYAKCEKATAAWTDAGDRHREHATNLRKAAGDQDLNKIVPDGIHAINPNPSFGLGGQLNDTTKVTMIPRYGQPPAKTDVPAEFAALVATDFD